MDSIPIFRRQTQKKNCSNLQRTDNEQNKNPADLKLSSQDSENKAPADCTRKLPLQQGMSRIPVLAKTFCLQTSSDFKQTYNKWEEKSLSVKVKRKRQFTRSVPFKPANPNKMQKAVEVHKPLTASQSKAQASDTLNSSRSSVAGKMVQNKISSVQTGPCAEVALNSMHLLSLKEPSKSSNAESLIVQNNSSKALNDKNENVQEDHAALLRVLRDKVVTPQSKPCNNLPQRVSVNKSQRKVGPPAGPVRCIQFSPDSAALQSILQNEGVKAEGPLGAMSRDSFCPSNRATSIYTAQRVPLKKSKAETNGGPVVRETPLTKGTPQRVRNTKRQPISSMKCYPTPYITPGNRNCKLNLQRLFDADNEQSTAGADKDPEIQTEPFPVEASSKNSSTEPVETSGNVKDEPKALLAQPRESVIMFSCKKLLRVPSFDRKVTGQPTLLDPVSSDQRNLSGALGETSAELAHHSNPSVLRLHRDLANPKTNSLSSAVVMLRKRFPPLEELRLDDEVSTYTLKSVTAAPIFHPPRPRCENPLASVLHFEESTKFVPISFDSPPALHKR